MTQKFSGQKLIFEGVFLYFIKIFVQFGKGVGVGIREEYPIIIVAKFVGV